MENIDDEETYLNTALASAKEAEEKVKKFQKERDLAIERANTADEALGVERSLKDQLQASLKTKEAELVARDARVKELQEHALMLTNKAARLELEKKEAEEAAELAQTHSFGLGYNEAVGEAKKMGWDYKKILLNPSVDPTEPAMEEPPVDGEEEIQGSNS